MGSRTDQTFKPIYIFMACDNKPEYLFYAPLAALFWQEIIGYDSVIALIFSEDGPENLPYCKLATQKIREWCPQDWGTLII